MPSHRFRAALLFLGAGICFGASDQTCAVSGEVVDSRSGARLPRVHVIFKDPADKTGLQYGALTREDGTFSVEGLKPATYTVSGERVGFAMPRGAKGHAAVTVAAKKEPSHFRLELVPVGSISGRITDAGGNSLEGATVGVEGAIRKEVTTDENGQYRIGGLTPGKYRVKASHGATLERMFQIRPEILADGSREIFNATTFYPGVVGRKQGGRVEVRAGEESRDTDIQLIGLPFVRISGKVPEMPPGTRDPYVNVGSREGWGAGVPMKPDGSFEIWGLDPGPYWLSASWQDPRGTETLLGKRMGTAVVQIEVGTSNIDNMELRVVPDSDIAGSISTDQVIPSNGQKTITLRQFRSGYPIGTPAPVGPDGKFRLEHVAAGKYIVSLSWDSAYVRSLRLGASTSEGAVLDLSHGSAGGDLVVELSPEVASVSGTVRDAQGKGVKARVILIQNYDDSVPLWREVRTEPNGGYTFGNTAPGAYRIVAIPEDELDVVRASDLEDYEESMSALEVQSGEKRLLDLDRTSGIEN